MDVMAGQANFLSSRMRSMHMREDSEFQAQRMGLVLIGRTGSTGSSIDIHQYILAYKVKSSKVVGLEAPG